ncbi:polyhomeotic-proximal chromatin protein-like isoform X3 [Macrobrachium nipponense]|uniref:polyhomeotic-proximal chromatin protein-like isoform X3 n=1 Tax=Macrobrachium nipponense TaxID=159736 RepID=UPI0030C7D817
MMSEIKEPSQDHTQQPQEQSQQQQQPQQQQQQQTQQEQPPPPQPPPTPIHPQHTITTLVPMQAAATAQPIVPQGSPQVGQQQAVPQATMTQVMQQGPQPAHSPHAVATSMTPQSPQFYVQASLASGMQPAPPAIAPAPGPQTSTTTVSALHQPLQHHLPQTIAHPGVSPSPMPQFSPQVQVIQGGIPGGSYLQQVYQNAQGQLIMPSNLTLQPAPGMNATPIQPNTLNGLNQPIQVIAAATGKPFQGQIAPHMLTTTGKTGVLQAGGQAGYSPAAIPTTGSQTLVIGQLPVGVISSQQHNILPAHSATHKSADMQKQAISWATQSTLHSPALLAQNQPIFIRGAQPGQENVFISNPQPQTMHVPNYSCWRMESGEEGRGRRSGYCLEGESPSIRTSAMMPPLQSMQQGPQAQKPRSGMEMPANIQPKAPTMRPTILPSNSPQIRPGASVSTQTAGQQLAPGHMPAPRPQNKLRGKSGTNRTSPAIAGTTQIASAQVAQNTVAVAATVAAAVTATPTAVAVNAGTQVMQQQAAVTPVTVTNPPTTVSTQNKISQAPSMQVITNMTQTKPGGPMAPPTAPLPPAGQPPPGLPPLVRAPVTKTQQANVAAIPQVTVAATPPTLIPSSTLQTPTQVQPITSQAPTSSPSPVLATTTMPPPQVTAVTSVSTPLQPPSLAPAVAAVTSTPNTIQPKQEMKQEPLPKKITPIAPITAPTVVPVSNVVTPVSQPQPQAQQPPPTLTTLNGTPPSSESGEVSDKPLQPTVNGTAHPVVPQPATTGPPKAMVKPQVLTHVIEGFVIHEASEPFPVRSSSLLTEIPKPRPPNYTNTIPVAAVTSSAQSPIGGQAEKENLPDDEANRKKGNDLTATSPKGDTAKCEFCGKTDLRSKFKRSKRFCSTSCAKRIGLFKNPDEPPSKRLREDGTLEEVESTPTTEPEEPQETKCMLMETGEMTEEEDGLSTPESPTKSQRVDILKWTVKDVVDFIQNLPGCKEYAEDFALQEIDGQALMLLKADHLMSAMSMKLGPALKICAKIESMRGDRKET